MYTYNKEKHQIVEKATMKEPDKEDYVYYSGVIDEQYQIDIYNYNNHLASLKSYPVKGEVKLSDGQEVAEGKDYEIRDMIHGVENYKAAYPLQQAEEDELWDEVVGIIIKAYTYKSIGAVLEFKGEMQKLKPFSITRK